MALAVEWIPGMSGMWLSLLIMFVVVEGFNDVVGHIVGTLGVERVVELEKPPFDESLLLKPPDEFGRGNAHLACSRFNGDDAELHHIAFVGSWRSFHLSGV